MLERHLTSEKYLFCVYFNSFFFLLLVQFVKYNVTLTFLREFPIGNLKMMISLNILIKFTAGDSDTLVTDCLTLS